MIHTRLRIGLALLLMVGTQALAQQSPRQRTSINMGWRFVMGDPEGATGKLQYENVKNWMMATGNDLVVDADSPRPARPQGNIGEDVSYTRADFNDGQWRELNLPHDWAVEGQFDPAASGSTGKLPFPGVAWYRKHLNIPATDSGKQFFLDIDGAMSYANVWCNGQYAGGWGYGYSSFRVDLTPYIRPGQDNVLAIRLDNPDRSSRWYPGSGIYRNVWLVTTSPVHVGQWGTYITTPDVSSSSATVDVKVTVNNPTGTPYDVAVRTEIFELDASDQRGRSVGSTNPVTVTLAPREPGTASARATVGNPKLWGMKTPNRYLAVTTLQMDGRTVDVYETPFGIRTIKWDAENGFFLNGERVLLQGVCQHHDLGALGGALYMRALERQFEILREMGTNAIRTSHNPPAPELVTLADKMGFVVICEAFDEWQRGKTPNGYHLLYDDWSEKDLRALVRRDRNSPSVIAWSIGNEIGEQSNAAGHRVGARLMRMVHEEDPTRPVTAAASNDGSGYNGFADIQDVFGWNYLRAPNNRQDYEQQMNMFVRFHAAHPNKPTYQSESASTISSRGEYAFPPMEQFNNKGGGGMENGQMSSYDLYAPGWANPPDWDFEVQDRSKFVAGEFVWTGFDYLGEPTRNGVGGGRGRRGGPPVAVDPGAVPPEGARGPATPPAGEAAPARGARRGGRGGGFGGFGQGNNPARSSYFGIIDLAGFPKDRYYLYQARWRPELKMAHILPHWNWPDRVGQVTPVHVYTSGDEGELFVNGKSQGRKKRGQYEYRLRWDEVVYEPGEVKVVTYKSGQPWAEATMKTTGPAAKLMVKPDRPTIVADGYDLSFVTVSIADASGAMVPATKNPLKFEISGPGEILAVDNGDPTGMEPFKATGMKAFNGLCLVIVKTKPGQAGDITLRATADGLEAGQAKISGVLRR